MEKLAGVKFEKDVHGNIKKVTLDMKYHATFIDDYLDHLRIEEAKKDAGFLAWDSVKKELDKKHGIDPKKLHNTGRSQRKNSLKIFQNPTI